MKDDRADADGFRRSFGGWLAGRLKSGPENRGGVKAAKWRESVKLRIRFPATPGGEMEIPL
jgi:hypothetical protein